MIKKIGVWLLVTILLTTFTLAVHDQPYHLKLLAVQDDNGNYTGSEADLYLELKEGSGRVFLDTFPLTKMDTQFSTRFAKEIACKHFKLDCQEYDFIFTIKARSNIIGGPSAGAAIAALTTIAVLDLEYDQGVTITGTINSGGVVGAVGGVKEKLNAAAEAGLKKVLIAKGAAAQSLVPNDNESNVSEEVDLIQYGKENLSLEVKEVMDLDEVLFHLTSLDLNHKEISVEENKEYVEIMKGLQNVLCNRRDKIEEEIKAEEIVFDVNISQKLNEKKDIVRNATQRSDHYSAASYCFGTNIDLKKYYYNKKRLSVLETKKAFQSLEKKISTLEVKLEEEEIKTIANLQAMMIVKERLNDVKEQIAKAKVEEGQENSYYLLAYAEERFFSALSWMQFFSMDGKKFVLDNESLKSSCLQKISESEQRQQYVSLFLGNYFLEDLKSNIDTAKEAQLEEEYELCLITAAQAKAEANAILSTLGLKEEALTEFFESKKKAVERVISENSAEGVFPILGYSYYEYAQSLKEEEKYTALVYLEYALEMSELSIYFPEETVEKKFVIKREWVLLGKGFLGGVLVSILGVIFVMLLKKKKCGPKSRKKFK